MVRLICFILLTLPATVFAQSYTVQQLETPYNGNVFCPAYYNEKLVVCSDQKDRISRKVLDVHGNITIDMYTFDPDQPEDIIRFDRNFRTDFHDGPINFSTDGNYAVVSRNLLSELIHKGLLKNVNLLGLYESKYIDSAWTPLSPLPFNDTSYSCTHPALDADGEMVIFSSNMPGGFGGFDLWKSKKINGAWAKPTNLGPTINSKFDEAFPSISVQSLFFSSNRNGNGDLDVFFTCLESKNCEVTRLKEPINSSFDDFGLISNDDGESGYLSSNRSGKDEIWSFEFDYPSFENCDSLVVDNFCYELYEEQAHELGSIESLIYRWQINEDVQYGVSIDYCFPEVGDYEITVDIIDTIVNVIYAEQDYFLMSITYEEQPYISAPDTVQPFQSFSLDPYKTNLPEVSVLEHYWFISDGHRYHSETTSHQFNEVGEYDVTLGVIGVNSYGDTIKDCTIKRIVCTTEEIELANRTSTIENLPENAAIVKETVAPKENDSTNVFHDIMAFTSPTKLDLLDTVFLDFTDTYPITEVYDSINEEYTYHIGKWKEIASAYPIWREIIQEHPKAKLVSFEETKEIQLNKVYEFENLLFKTDKWDLSKEAQKSIDELAIILREQPLLNAVIHAHTDNVGNEADNMVLSENRAKSVLEYLISQGIRSSRLSSKGYGESQPKEDNSTEEGRKANRRVEFTVSEK